MGMAGRLPMTMATAMASPIARPDRQRDGGADAGPAAGSTALRTTCHRVAPSAIAASRSVDGHAGKSGAAQGDHGRQGP